MRVEEAERLVQILVGILAVSRASPLVLQHQPPAHASLDVFPQSSVRLVDGALIEVPTPAADNPVYFLNPLLRRIE